MRARTENAFHRRQNPTPAFVMLGQLQQPAYSHQAQHASVRLLTCFYSRQSTCFKPECFVPKLNSQLGSAVKFKAAEHLTGIWHYQTCQRLAPWFKQETPLSAQQIRQKQTRPCDACS